jgi:hypothetical protein
MAKNASHSHSLDLFAIAHRAMIEEGFVPDLPGAVKQEVQSLVAKPAPRLPDSSVRDLRTLLWSSIDDSKSG